ncbi:uncharacterized protein T551_00894 [Pneumocystis jirovecii RU7]|uniref:Survival Motor Neuron Gemin2-binding domain-containing protein n=1 Tax=Pneumocystis jirovecii (strain RU7) TaxID=1408657 RepID=A0A0W4ZV31_PNEJ7|nr:uncharacterized protein T551_00894 [Pneumocystis jirovecii RU7]KTW32212.1 hypothetical protein T551_00894 [Pneumocystis jirovecii RU7]
MELKDEEATLSHEQIWDDSTLIAAWEATVNEYKTYHSQVNDDNNISEIHEFSHISDLNFQNSINIESFKENLNELGSDQTSEVQKEAEVEDAHKKLLDEFMKSPSVALPFQIFNNDQTLKNLLMSWYYAGCWFPDYTGYYMGQDSINKKNQE